MSDLQYWLALNLSSVIGPVVARKLVSAFGSPANVFQMSAHDLRSVDGIGPKRLEGIINFNQWDRVNREIDYAGENNISIITPDHPSYPEGLRHIHSAPLVLYVKGILVDDDKCAVAMVGSRSATDYGMDTAYRMGYKLASYGITVVSGMARGIDTASHRGALKAGGRTIAVLGSGIDIPYPATNKDLMKDIESAGAVISEFPLGTPPARENFPRRNRIISALSFGTLVVEAALDSGSLITVAYALEQGKEVFAVPGNISSGHSRGTNDLIKKGAKLVDNVDEVVNELSLQLKGALKKDTGAARTELPSMNSDEKLVYHYLASGPKHVDRITREINIPSSRTLSLLLNLELKGIVRQAQGKNFTLTGSA